MTKLPRLISSYLTATAPTSDVPLLRLLRSRCDDQHFVRRVIDVVSSKEAFFAAKLLLPNDAQKVINRLDKALDIAHTNGNMRLWRRCLKYLCRICGHHRLVPKRYKLTYALCKDGTKPVDGGGFSEVWKGSYRGRQVAIKALKVYMTSDKVKIGKRFCKEVLMWHRLQHQNILPLIGVSCKDFIMVSEWMENGNIRQYVLNRPEANRPSLLLGATDGLMYLHSQDIVHGDLKGANILIKGDGTPCLADFGLTTVMPTETFTFSSPSSGGGTYRWMSPELLNPDEHSECPRCTMDSDRYAFGMVIYEVLTGNIPFPSLPEPAVVAQVQEGARPEIPIDTPAATHTSGLWTIVQQCWDEDPAERPPLSEIRRRLSIAAEAWPMDPSRSPSSDGYVSVHTDILLSSGGFSECTLSELGQGMSPYSILQYSLYSTPERATTPASVRNSRRMRIQFYGMDQNQAVTMQYVDVNVVGQILEDVPSDDADSEYHLEPPPYVYDTPDH